MAANRTPPNLFREFLRSQKEQDKSKTHRYWASRWKVHPSMVGLWSLPLDSNNYRRIGPDNREVFQDLLELGGITMEEYYRNTPPPPSPGRRNTEAQ